MKNAKILSLLIGLSLIVGCNGNTSGGGEAGGGSFVSGDSTTGRVSLDLNTTEVPVAGTTGFRFFVFDQDNRPVENIRVVCDSEQEVAIIEPTTGHETTDSFGAISGIIGCRAPGSYLFGCRLSNGANKREFVTVLCRGDVPAGFSGFPGAAGGGLGGGTLPPGSGGPGAGDTENIRITSISVQSLAQESGTTSVQIDTFQSVCDNDTPAPADDFAEIFGDDFVNLTVTNGSGSLVRFTHMNYTVDRGRGDGGDAESPDLALAGELAANASATISLSSLFTDATGSGKTYADGTTSIPVTLGIRNVTFRLYGLDQQGEEFVVERSLAISFDSYDNCAAGE